MKNITLAWLPLVLSGCLVQSDPVAGPPGPKGETGEQGSPGKDGVPDNSALQLLQQQISALEASNSALQTKLSTLEQQAGNPECPAGYVKDPAASPAFLSGAIICRKGADEVVKVGSGGASFWIDRFEASVWTTADGPQSGTPKFAPNDDSDVLFPKNGQHLVDYFALSITGRKSAVNVTWFQAVEACSASGKRLPTNQEWQRAVRGAVDPGANDGIQNNKCNTLSATARSTGLAVGDSPQTSCTSDWGAEDMIGNIWEMTSDWFAGLYDNMGYGTSLVWPSAPNAPMNDDYIWNVSSYAFVPGVSWTKGMPAVATRGGSFTYGTSSGAFAIDFSGSPLYFAAEIGFRCVVPR